MTATHSFHSYVALGDSFTEGLDDLTSSGEFRGWADRLAEHLAASNPDFRYANLAIRGRLIGAVHSEQLGPALAMQPDLASVMAGTNDILRRQVTIEQIAALMEEIQAALIGQGATVLTMTMPDLSESIPIARLVRSRVLEYNAAMREVAARTGAVMLDMAANDDEFDPRLWSDDRLHGNALAHERIAAASADALGVPVADDSWKFPLPGAHHRGRVRIAYEHTVWIVQHFVPWIVRRLRGRSSGDGVTPKRPQLTPVGQHGSE
ncbi:MAG: SGNH/GDSL hydrolase family protein [Thermoleophilaceae bacterium]|nr:SGNH/GDSL hydrolase family protein [Thermoleophilaceae bacterium]